MSKRDNLAAVAVALITLVAKRLTQPISPANRFNFMKRQLEQLRNWVGGVNLETRPKIGS